MHSPIDYNQIPRMHKLEICTAQSLLLIILLLNVGIQLPRSHGALLFIPHRTPPPQLIRYTVLGIDFTIAGGVVHAHDVFVYMAVKDAPFDDGEGADGDS
jgi:hypothetical protein